MPSSPTPKIGTQMTNGDNPFRKAQRRLRDGTRAARRALVESGLVENVAKKDIV
jgi:hypothetical protein